MCLELELLRTGSKAVNVNLAEHTDVNLKQNCFTLAFDYFTLSNTTITNIPRVFDSAIAGIKYRIIRVLGRRIPFDFERRG